MHRLKQTALIFSTFILTLMSLSSQAYEENELPYVELVNSTDLREDAKLSRDRQLPIMLLFSMDDCSYCQFVEEEFLKPMLRNAGYAKQVIIRRIMTDDYGSVIDFDGDQISTLDLSTHYGAYITPTIVFLSPDGKELAPRIYGVRNTEMYGLDLDEGIELSLQLIKQQQTALTEY